MKIVIDANGGDNSPKAMVEGALLATNKNKKISVILVGDENKINPLLGEGNPQIEVVNAPDSILNSDSPTLAFKQKPNSSLAVAFEYLKDNKADSLVSAGSTGAILVGGFTKVGRLKGVSRPALAPTLPTETGGKVLLLDVGANMDAKPINMLHFAVMGSSYMKACHGVKNPKVALLNVGSEDEKGNQLTKEAFELLKEQKGLNFVGNIEAREVMSGKYDVVVADGFSGNIALKAIEGAVSLATGQLKHVFGGLKGKLAGALVLGRLKKVKNKLDYNKYGGSPFLGMKKIIIKSHGSSKSETIKNACLQAFELHEAQYLQKLEKELEV